MQATTETSVNATTPNEFNMTFKVPLWSHQLEALRRTMFQNSFAFFFEVGTGKTATAINALRMKMNSQREFLPTIIFSPPITLLNWKRELLMHTQIPEEKILILTGSQKQRVKQISVLRRDKIVITNYESLLMKELFEYFEKYNAKALIFDESHRLKSPTSIRSKKASELSENAQYKFLLSGSPVLNSMMDLFMQYKVLDSGRTFGRNFFAFRNRYFYDKNAAAPAHVTWRDWVAKPDADKEIKEKISFSSMHVKKEECLDLPPLVKKKVYVDMAPDQKKAYGEMMKDFITVVSDRACVAELAVTKALRLQQIVSGFVTLEEGLGVRTDMEFTDNPRAQALSDILEDLTPHHKVIVWAVFKENYKQIREVLERLKLSYVEVHGEVSQKEKLNGVDKFNTDPTCRVFLGHPASGGIGINLVSASISVFYSRNFSLENDIQAEARNYRSGSEQHKKITRIDLVTPDTIDEEVLEALSQKKQIGESVLRAYAMRKKND
jgi:SNF2 family DNA or RNA helicase